jgi:hypothetical protein
MNNPYSINMSFIKKARVIFIGQLALQKSIGVINIHLQA